MTTMITCQNCAFVKPQSHFAKSTKPHQDRQPHCYECGFQPNPAAEKIRAAVKEGRSFDYASPYKSMMPNVPAKAELVPLLKPCGKCKGTKPIGSFIPDVSHPDGLSHYCRTCHNENAKQSYHKRGLARPRPLHYKKRSKDVK